MAKKQCKSSSGAPFTSQKMEVDFWQPEVAGSKKHPEKLTRKLAKNCNMKHPNVFLPATMMSCGIEIACSS